MIVRILSTAAVLIITSFDMSLCIVLPFEIAGRQPAYKVSSSIELIELVLPGDKKVITKVLFSTSVLRSV